MDRDNNNRRGGYRGGHRGGNYGGGNRGGNQAGNQNGTRGGGNSNAQRGNPNRRGSNNRGQGNHRGGRGPRGNWGYRGNRPRVQYNRPAGPDNPDSDPDPQEARPRIPRGFKYEVYRALRHNFRGYKDAPNNIKHIQEIIERNKQSHQLLTTLCAKHPMKNIVRIAVELLRRRVFASRERAYSFYPNFDPDNHFYESADENDDDIDDPGSLTSGTEDNDDANEAFADIEHEHKPVDQDLIKEQHEAPNQNWKSHRAARPATPTSSVTQSRILSPKVARPEAENKPINNAKAREQKKPLVALKSTANTLPTQAVPPGPAKNAVTAEDAKKLAEKQKDLDDLAKIRELYPMTPSGLPPNTQKLVIDNIKWILQQTCFDFLNRYDPEALYSHDLLWPDGTSIDYYACLLHYSARILDEEVFKGGDFHGNPADASGMFTIDDMLYTLVQFQRLLDTNRFLSQSKLQRYYDSSVWVTKCLASPRFRDLHELEACTDGLFRHIDEWRSEDYEELHAQFLDCWKDKARSIKHGRLNQVERASKEEERLAGPVIQAIDEAYKKKFTFASLDDVRTFLDSFWDEDTSSYRASGFGYREVKEATYTGIDEYSGFLKRKLI